MQHLKSAFNWTGDPGNLFHFRMRDETNGTEVYNLNTSSLSRNKCHMIFPGPDSVELLIASTLEYFTFHPLQKHLNDQYDFQPIKMRGIVLYQCSFPKEYKDVCERIAKQFKLTMHNIPRVIVSEKIALEFPEEENLLSFTGDLNITPIELQARLEEIRWVGDCLERLDID